MNIAVIPIDNRPICYDLIKDVLSIDKNINLFMPDIKDLGGLQTKSNTDKIIDFIENLSDIDYLIVSLDTLAYGGLVASRRCNDSFDIIKQRIEKFKIIAKNKAKKILAFSSIMRISNNNINEEEKEYWAQWGKRIFDWSYYLHKSEVQKCYNCVHNKIPDDIIQDYINTRKRNFEINKIYLQWAQEGFFDTLIFSKDDCAEFGLNVKEAQELETLIKKNNIERAKVKTGADEIPLSLITRSISYNYNVKINPVFIEPDSVDFISKYEDISIKNCVLAQIELVSCKVSADSDLDLIINNFKFEQGDLVLGDVINNIQKEFEFPKKPYFIADVNNANGADNNFILKLLEQDTKNFFGYCGYNTSANSIGCSIFCACVKYSALKNGSYNDDAFKKIQFIRLFDDWIYQTLYRKQVRENVPLFSDKLEEIKEEMTKKAKEISAFLNYYPCEIKLSLPWDRSFEIRVEIP